jgi:hypothetical protein
MAGIQFSQFVARHGRARLGLVWQGKVWLGRQGKAGRQGRAGISLSRFMHGVAGAGGAGKAGWRRGQGRDFTFSIYGTARQGPGEARQGKARHGEAGRAGGN